MLKSVNFTNKEAVRKYENEVGVHGRIEHPGVVEFIDSFVEEDRGWIVLADGGVDLRQIIYEVRTYEEKGEVASAWWSCVYLGQR